MAWLWLSSRNYAVIHKPVLLLQSTEEKVAYWESSAKRLKSILVSYAFHPAYAIRPSPSRMTPLPSQALKGSHHGAARFLADRMIYTTLRPPPPCLLRPPARLQVRQPMMMSKTVTMPLMMAMRIAPMPLTTAMMQRPMAWKTDSICAGAD